MKGWEYSMNVNYEPTISNSQPVSHTTFTVIVDRLTIMGDLDESKIPLLEKQLQNPMYIMRKALTSCFIVDVDKVVHVEYDKFKGQSFNRRNMRVDFNPATISEPEKKMIWEVFVSKMTNRAFSRVDIAFDTDKDLTNYYLESQQSMKEIHHYGLNSKIETRYFGSRKSDRYIRIYNKKQQLKEVKQIEIDSPHQWRIEFELKRSWTVKWEDCLDGFRIIQPDWTTIEKLNDRAMVYMLLNEKSEWGKLHKNTKTKYRKLIKELKTPDLISEMQESLNINSLKIKNQLIDWMR